MRVLQERERALTQEGYVVAPSNVTIRTTTTQLSKMNSGMRSRPGWAWGSEKVAIESYHDGSQCTNSMRNAKHRSEMATDCSARSVLLMTLMLLSARQPSIIPVQDSNTMTP